jgi:hypothetical protein
MQIAGTQTSPLFDERKMTVKSPSPILSRKSRAPKHGFWLMRGAQPATIAGARLFAGSPIPAFPIAR